MGFLFKHNKGQSSLDYIALLIVTASVIIAIISSEGLRGKLQTAFNTVGDKVVNEIGNIR